MSDITKVFDFEDGTPVRVVVRDGEPWFVATDVCGVLGHTNTGKAVGDHCKAPLVIEHNEPFHAIPSGPGCGRGGMRLGTKLTIVPERDVYRLIMRSKLPAAERFEEWVVGEVLPSIRKHGAYLTPEKIEEALLDPDVLIRLATDLKTERLNRLHAEQQRDEAIRTKALIGSRREATAMATASAAIRRAEALAEQVGDSKNWKQVKAIPWIGEFFVISKGMWSVVGKTLKNISAEFGFEVRKAPDSAYGEVCAFHVQTIHVLRCRLLADSALLAKYRLSH